MSDENTTNALDFEAGRRALLARAAELGLLEGGDPDRVTFASAEDERALLLGVLDEDVPWRTPDEAEARRWFDAHAERYRRGAVREVSHILYAVTPRVPVAALLRLAEERLAAIAADPQRFDELARRESNCPSGAEGGRLGALSQGEAVPEFESAVFAAKAAGLLPALVASRHGFHIVRIDRVEEGELPSFEDCREQVLRDLGTEAWTAACRQYLARLSDGSASPLVQ